MRGEAGIGKTRLVEEFCDRLRLRGSVVATGLCVPGEAVLPFAPVVGILRGLGRQAGATPTASLLRAFGGEPDREATAEPESAVPADPPPDGEFAKTVLFESVLETLVELAGRAPLVLVVEDLQWADSGSTHLVDFLTRNLGDSRVLIICTLREEELGRDHRLGPWLSEFGRHPRVTQLSLNGLDRGELAMLIATRTGRAADPSFVESIWERSQGNPFFAEELLAAPGSASLPTALQAVILSRVDELSAPAQHLLSIAAVAGADVDHQVLEAIGGLDPDVMAQAITESVDKSILVVDETRTGYRFRHALLREAVYGSLLPARSRRIHRDIAVALSADPLLAAAVPSHRTTELAAHWWAAGDWAAARQPSLDAAAAALGVSAFPEAFTFMEHALLADERDPAADPVARRPLLERAADVAYLAGANARAVELAQAAIDAIDADQDPVAAARCYTLLGRNFWGVGDSASAFEAYHRAVELLPADVPSVERAWVLAEEARGYMLMSRSRVGEERAREAIAAAREVGARAIEGHALNTLGCCRNDLGYPAEAIALIRDSVTIAEEIGSPDDLNRAYTNLSHVLADSGRLEDAVSVMFDSAAIGEDLWGVRLNGATSNGVEALVRLGRYEEADHLLGQLGSHALGVCAPSPWTLPAPMMIRRGRFQLAEQQVTIARSMTLQLEDVQQTAGVLALTAELDLELGRPEAASDHIDQALALAARSDDESQVPELCMLACPRLADRGEAAHAQRTASGSRQRSRRATPPGR